ncbi:hypothetical protein D9M71_50330 [compost metagenome]
MPRGRQRHATGIAIKELYTQPVLKNFHVSANGRLRDMQRLRGSNVTAQARSRLESADGIKRRKPFFGHGAPARC